MNKVNTLTRTSLPIQEVKDYRGETNEEGRKGGKATGGSFGIIDNSLTHMHTHTQTYTHTPTHPHPHPHTYTPPHTHMLVLVLVLVRITTARIGYVAPFQGVSQQKATRLVAPLAAVTLASSPQLHGPLSAVGVLICGLARPMR